MCLRYNTATGRGDVITIAQPFPAHGNSFINNNVPWVIDTVRSYHHDLFRSGTKPRTRYYIGAGVGQRHAASSNHNTRYRRVNIAVRGFPEELRERRVSENDERSERRLRDAGVSTTIFKRSACRWLNRMIRWDENLIFTNRSCLQAFPCLTSVPLYWLIPVPNYSAITKSCQKHAKTAAKQRRYIL